MLFSSTEVLNYVKNTMFNEDGIPYPDMRALANDEFKVAGELMASSILQGGPAPSFLADIVYSYIIHGSSSIQTDTWAALVNDETLKQAIEKVGQ